MSTHLALWSDLEVKLYQPTLAHPSGISCFKWNCGRSGFSLFLRKGLSSKKWLEKTSAWLLLQDKAVAFELAGIQVCKLFDLNCKLFDPFENCSFRLEKNLWEMGSQLSKYFEGAPTQWLLPILCPSSCTFLTKRTNLIKGNLKYQWPLWGTFWNPQT